MELALKRRAQAASGRKVEELRRLPDLEEQLRECLADMRKNQALYDLEPEPELVEQRIYEYTALQCRYNYLMRQAREQGLRAIL